MEAAFWLVAKPMLNSQSICPHHLSWLLTSVCLFRNLQKGNRKYAKWQTSAQTSICHWYFFILLEIVINGNQQLSDSKFGKQSCRKVMILSEICKQEGWSIQRPVWCRTLSNRGQLNLCPLAGRGPFCARCLQGFLMWACLTNWTVTNECVARTEAARPVWTFSKCSERC